MIPLLIALCASDAVNDECAVRIAINKVIAVATPLRGFTRKETAALLAITAREESHWDMAAVGDHGHSHCALQVWTDGDVSTPEKCVSAALGVMRWSIDACPVHPMAGYCGGCDRPAAQRISDHRIAEARKAARRRAN